jgi:hypothetical protein
VSEVDGGNPARIRARAEEIAAYYQASGLTPLEMGYVTVALCLSESAWYLRDAAARGLSPGRLRDMAGILQCLAEDARLIGEIA